MKHKAQYAVTHTKIEYLAARSEAQQFSIDNAFLGPNLQRTLIALVKNTALVVSTIAYTYLVHYYYATKFVF